MATPRRNTLTTIDDPRAARARARDTVRTSGASEPPVSARAPNESMQVLAEEIEQLRSDLEKVREEVATLRKLVVDGRISGAYRGTGR